MLAELGQGDAVFLAAVVSAVPATIAAVAAIVGASQARKARHHAAAVDDSVNHRHPNEPRMLDIVKSTAAKVNQIDSTLAEHGRRLDGIESYLTDPPRPPHPG